MKPNKSYVTVEFLPIEELLIDPRVQRSIIEQHALKIAEELHLPGLGAFEVSRRSDGKVYVIDGQHRRRALQLAGLGDTVVRCVVHHGLTLQQEARLFLTLNRSRKTSPIEGFRKSVLAGDPESIAVKQILDEHDLTVVVGRCAGGVAAIGRVLDVYRGTKVRPEGPHPWALDMTLSVITQAWGRETAGLDGVMIGGVGTVVLRYGATVDYDRLIRVLAKRAGGPARMIGAGRDRQETLSCSLPEAIADISIAAYNKGLRRGQLGGKA